MAPIFFRKTIDKSVDLCYNCIKWDNSEMIMEEQTFKKIRSQPFLRGVDEPLLRRVCNGDGAFVRSYRTGDVIRSPAETSAMAGIVLSGRAAVTTRDPARSVLLRYLGAGDPFGIANLFCSEPFVSLIRAASPCSCLFLTEDAVRVLLGESPAFRETYIGFLGGRIRFLNRKIGYLTAGSAERRLALYLSSLGAGEVRLPLSLSALSELLDVGRASLYRALDRLTADGYLVRNGRNLTVPDPEALLRAYL